MSPSGLARYGVGVEAVVIVVVGVCVGGVVVGGGVRVAVLRVVEADELFEGGNRVLGPGFAAEQFVGEQDLPVRGTGGGGGVRDEDSGVVLTVHPDDAEPGVLLFDEDEHRVLVHRGFTGQIRQVGQGLHIVELRVARFPPVFGAREQCGEVHRDSPTGHRGVGPAGGQSVVRLSWVPPIGIVAETWAQREEFGR